MGQRLSVTPTAYTGAPSTEETTLDQSVTGALSLSSHHVKEMTEGRDGIINSDAQTAKTEKVNVLIRRRSDIMPKERSLSLFNCSFNKNSPGV